MGSTREALPPQPPLANTSRGNDQAHRPRSQEPGTHSYPPSGLQTVRSEDSWIELGSQPSSSSLSSIGANDEIITTGLRIQRHHSHHSRRRRGQQIFMPQDIDIVYPHRHAHHPGSSQDEYDESESEDDRVLSSSNEDLRRGRETSYLPRGSYTSEGAMSSEDEDDDDDNLTALGSRTNAAGFVPQPNAFSHPPASQGDSRARPSEGYGSRAHDSRSTQRNSRPNMRQSARRQRQAQPQQQHSPYNMISPSHQADHDAALRASLSTLLSCAAAARGLPKTDAQGSSPATDRNGAGRTADPSGFRLVPESVAMGDDEPGPAPSTRPSTHHASEVHSPRIPRPRSSPLRTPSKTRRKASPSKDRAGQPSAKRSRRTTSSDPNSSSSLVGPTLMTWVISAGVVVLFSAISFSAGYVLGREVGRIEGGQFYGPGGGMGGGERTGTNCGKEAVRGGLRRLKWIGGGSGSGISA